MEIRYHQSIYRTGVLMLASAAMPTKRQRKRIYQSDFAALTPAKQQDQLSLMDLFFGHLLGLLGPKRPDERFGRRPPLGGEKAKRRQ